MSEDKKNKSFFDILKLGGLDRKFCDVVADRNLKLAGFTLTSLALALGFFQAANSATDVILVTLLFSLFLFLVGSQLAHNAEKFYEIFLADIFESASIIILMFSFGLFITSRINYFAGFILIGVMFFGAFYSAKSVYNIITFYKEFKEKKTQEVQSCQKNPK